MAVAGSVRRGQGIWPGAKVTDGWKVDRAERGIRFGCGAIVGAAIGFFLAIRDFTGEMWVAVLIAVVIALVFGILATVYGDRFWERLIDWFR